jgi:DNA-binding transcriptional LysR family regulator
MLANSQSKLEGRWDDVRLFLALYRQRTLTAAALSVGLDASTLSRRLALLEEALGGTLFDRTRDGLLPTEGAELLLPAAEEMAAAHARFSRDASGFERVTEGTVRLSVPPGVAESFIAPALVRLRAQHPGIRIELDASIGFVDLTRREADLAIRSRRPQTGDLVSVKLGQQRWLPMLATAEAKRRGIIRSWSELSWIGWGDDLASFPPERWLDKHVPRAALALRTSHFSAQVVAVESGLGAALLPHRYLRAKTLALIRHAPALAASIAEIPSTEPWLVGHRALRAVPRVAAVWAFLVEEFARLELEERCVT